jgi:hypothetical protein
VNLKVSKFNPSKGDLVYVCYDGKIGRKKIGTIKQRRGFAILVEFTPWCEEDKKSVECWFVRKNDQAFGGYLRIKDSLMKNLFGTPGDWYSVFPIFSE